MKKKLKMLNNEFQKLGYFEIIVLVLYTILISVIAFFHEPSLDEAQSFLIARNLNFLDIIKQLKYEGHPFLWYYMIAPFVKLGGIIQAQQIISISFSVACAYLILTKSPFNKVEKLLLVFSSGMIYYYSAFARPYCMIPFFLALIASFYKKRKEHPYIYALLLGLLANTHLMMVPTSGILILLFWGSELISHRKQLSKKEKSTLLKSFFLAIFLVFICVSFALLGFFFCKITSHPSPIIYTITDYMGMFLDNLTKTTTYFYGDKSVPLYYDILLCCIFLLCAIGSKNSSEQSLVFFIQFLFITIIHSIFWFAIPTRTFIVIYTLMFWCWIELDKFKTKKIMKRNIWIEIALVLLIIITSPGTYKCVYEDIRLNFSAGEDISTYIKNNIPKDSVFIFTYLDGQQVIASYFDKDNKDYKFYLANTKRYTTFSVWDEKWLTYTESDSIIEAVTKLKKEYDHVYIVNSTRTKDSTFYNLMKVNRYFDLELKYSVDKDKMMNELYSFDQVLFKIYEVN